MKRLRLGDIFEIATPKGVAYGQYINKHEDYGAVIRIFRGMHERRPPKIAEIMNEVQFVTFFPLQNAIKHGDVTIVGNEPIPPNASKFPTFRSGLANPATGKASVWWLWDGVKEWRVDNITPEQRGIPILEVVNDTLLIERIVDGWTPENDPT